MIICKICNKQYGKLGSHLTKTHKMTTHEYLNMFPFSEIGRIKTPLEINIDYNGKDLALKLYNNKNKYKRNSLEYYKCIYGEIEGIARYKRRNENASKTLSILKPGSKENLKKVWGDEYEVKMNERGLKDSKSKKERKNGTVEYYINKYGITEGEKQYGEYIEKLKARFTEKRFCEIYGDDEGEKRYKQFLSKSLNTKENFIKRHGEFEGEKRWDEYINTLKTSQYFTIGWWEKKYSKKEALKKYKEHQTKNIGSFIKKYGDVEGRKRYNKWVEVCTSYLNNPYISKESEIFYNELNFPDLKIEKRIGKYTVDFIYKNRIIEYYGTHWHADPLFYESYELIQPLNLSTTEIHMRDDRRLKYLKDKGYEILIVWAYDFSTKKSDIINDCKNFLNNGEK